VLSRNPVIVREEMANRMTARVLRDCCWATTRTRLVEKTYEFARQRHVRMLATERNAQSTSLSRSGATLPLKRRTPQGEGGRRRARAAIRAARHVAAQDCAATKLRWTGLTAGARLPSSLPVHVVARPHPAQRQLFPVSPSIGPDAKRLYHREGLHRVDVAEPRVEVVAIGMLDDERSNRAAGAVSDVG
jgi:hypothetical protein